jgi:hypothetical protein
MVQLDYYDTNRTPDNDKVVAFARRWAGLVLTRQLQTLLVTTTCSSSTLMLSTAV